MKASFGRWAEVTDAYVRSSAIFFWLWAQKTLNIDFRSLTPPQLDSSLEVFCTSNLTPSKVLSLQNLKFQVCKISPNSSPPSPITTKISSVFNLNCHPFSQVVGKYCCDPFLLHNGCLSYNQHALMWLLLWLMQSVMITFDYSHCSLQSHVAFACCRDIMATELIASCMCSALIAFAIQQSSWLIASAAAWSLFWVMYES